ncbi:MAG: arginine--tRNA ligase [Anaerohalosphaera sp.]|nr:arginine--tRNA ligase [Anaerohalosphaera sp.]
MKRIVDILEERVGAALCKVASLEDCAAMVRASADGKFGDYQANGVMALAKRLKRNPRELAGEVVAALEVDDVSESPEIAGPGFINFRLKNDYLAARLMEIAGDESGRLAIDKTEKPQRVVVDLSAPNIAKQMHVGHLEKYDHR